MNKIDLFGGTGFIGTTFNELYKDIHIHPRNDTTPIYDEVLYMISTTDNYNIYSDLFLDVNTNLTHLLKVLDFYKSNEERRKTAIFNFVSSWFVYGKVDELPAKETTICNPRGFYSITKKCAEDLIISFCETYGMKYRIFRLSNVYGGNDKGVSNKKNALQFLIGKIIKNKNIPLYYNGNFIRDYTHVRDICRGIKLCMEVAETNTIINIGSGIPYRFRNLIEFVIKETKSNSKIEIVDPTDFHRIVQVKNMYLDVSKLKSYGFEPLIPIEEGLAEIIVSNSL